MIPPNDPNISNLGNIKKSDRENLHEEKESQILLSPLAAKPRTPYLFSFFDEPSSIIYEQKSSGRTPTPPPTPTSYTFDTKEELQTGVNLWISNNASALSLYGDINTWTFAPTLTDMSNLFENKTTFNSDISNWDVSSVTNMSRMFSGASSFNQPIGSWNVSNVTSMISMFRDTPFNQDISSWDVSKVTNMSNMFRSSNFNQPLNSWDVSSVIDMGFMFYLATSFNGNISSWDVSSVTNMGSMFYGAASFNQDIGSWNTSNVLTMGSMFRGTTIFNQDLTNWCVFYITSEPFNFSLDSALTTGNKPVWGTCPP